jgi:glycine cleavage system H protein
MDPNTIRFAKTHEWATVHNGIARVGISRFAVDQLTDVTYLELPKVGKTVQAGEEVGVIESVKSTSPIYSPVSGKVIAINEAVIGDTSLINADPYEKGWLFEIELASGASLDHLLTAEQYDQQIASEG